MDLDKRLPLNCSTGITFFHDDGCRTPTYNVSMKAFFTLILFFYVTTSFAYRSQGVENIQNVNSLIRLAEKEGFKITSKEKNIKKNLTKLKKNDKSAFQEQINKKIENSTEYQGYLLEVRDGLKNIESAKQIAKFVMFQKIKEDWKILRTTILNSYGEDSFQKVKSKIVEQINGCVYVPAPKGFSFEFSNWGIAVVYPSLKTVQWKIQFNSKNDGNILEDGADKIKIQDGNGGSQIDEKFDF